MKKIMIAALAVGMTLLTSAAMAQSLGSQCRAAMRAQLKNNPACRIADAKPYSPCAVAGQDSILLGDMTHRCVAAGGPGKMASVRR